MFVCVLVLFPSIFVLLRVQILCQCFLFPVFLVFSFPEVRFGGRCGSTVTLSCACVRVTSSLLSTTIFASGTIVPFFSLPSSQSNTIP